MVEDLPQDIPANLDDMLTEEDAKFFFGGAAEPTADNIKFLLYTRWHIMFSGLNWFDDSKFYYFS